MPPSPASAPHPAPEGLLPQFWALIFYGAFYALGTQLHARPDWLPRAEAGEALQLTLSGERAAQTFVTQPPSLWRRLRQALRPPDTSFLNSL